MPIANITRSPVWRLGKFNVYQHLWAPLLSGVYLILKGVVWYEAVWVAVLSAVSFSFIVAVTSTLDDINGFQDGSDVENYGEDDSRRSITKKPLLTKEISTGQAYLLAGGFALGSALCFFLSGLPAAPRSGLDIPLALWAASLLMGAFYSWGIKFTHYWLGGELCIWATTAFSFVWPIALAGIPISFEAWFLASLLGSFFVLISAYSNLNDRVADKKIGRRNAATLGGITGTGALIVGMLAVPLVLLLAGVLSEVTSVFAVVALVPPYFLAWVQWRKLLSGDALEARRLGLKNFNLASVCVLAASLVLVR